MLTTGGAGHISSTVASARIDFAITPVVLDNLSTGNAEFVEDRIFYRSDIADTELDRRIFAEHSDLDAATHCAALAAMEESVRGPLAYYRENVAKTAASLENLIEIRPPAARPVLTIPVTLPPPR
ncbi:NAD-dependent epimerase/dehydratase family protein [Actinoplanes regularis]|uniref:NAD-dependent epimerase/dehydratase family protein n=1 Tax=Actinoplanes regularis TaxID=52697 RepID=UPI0025571629|nr:NAD-dependent epimerase/dehydratase family protein [Actinoplanes regularis]